MAKKKKQDSIADNASKLAVSYQKIDVLPIAAKEGWEMLTPGQYLHIKDQVRQLVGFGIKRYESNLTIAPFGDFWELKDKGGTLGRKNVRVYFAFNSELNKIIVLHTYKKEDDGAAPPHINLRLKNRYRLYLQGHYSKLLTYERGA